MNMSNLCNNEDHEMHRREFIKTVGISMAGASLGAQEVISVSEMTGFVAPVKEWQWVVNLTSMQL